MAEEPHPPPPPPAAALLATWHDGVTAATAHLAALSALRTHPADGATRAAMAPALAAATASLATVEGALADLRAAVAAAEADAAAAEATEAAVAALRRRVEAVGGAVPPPARLYSPLGKGVFGGVGGRGGAGGSPTGVAAAAAAAAAPPVTAAAAPAAAAAAAAPAVPAAAAEPAPPAAPPGGVPRRRPGGAGGVAPAPPPPPPIIPPVPEAAIAAAPQYIRGRLTEAKVAAVAAALTSALAWKYGLLRRRPAALSPADAASRDALEGMAKAETGGRPYVTEGDVRRWGGVKMDATWKGGVGLLRHVGSIKEVRGVGGKVKAWLVMGEGE